MEGREGGEAGGEHARWRRGDSKMRRRERTEDEGGQEITHTAAHVQIQKTHEA